ncbi:MAG: protein-export chaperone SecB [Caulobacteraceae bacterium]|nr:protein-export chaperone SecB [Caulobacteraceae bacterium]
MTDIESSAPTVPEPVEASGPQGPAFRVLSQYLRDLSFENPGAPETLIEIERPAIDMGVELNVRTKAETVYEVELRRTARALRGETVIFHVEVQYCGLFQVAGMAPEHVEQILMIECPRYLFPFSRRIISDATADGGFPPFQVEPIDFVAIYQARKETAEAPVAGEA